MSSLTENLQTIYEVKQEIKEVLGTSSDIFTEYPNLIEEAIGQGGGLDWDEVASYGYIVPESYTNLTHNGSYSVAQYAYAYVNVPETLPTVYLSYDYDESTGEYGSQVELERNRAGNYIYYVGGIRPGNALHFRFDVEYNSTGFPINGAIYWDSVDINGSNVQYQGQTQLAQFITDGGEEYISPESTISNSLEVDVNDVMLSLEPTETNGVMNMNVFVGWIDPTT